MKKALFILLHIFPLLSFAQDKYYTSPVKIPLYLSANFGELRSNHFHSGIDIKTQQVTGIPVSSVAGGYISRVVVSPTGYGNALYIDHPNGTTTVYGHLLRFRDDIREYVKNIQYQKQSFRTDVQVPPNRFPVLQDELIAYSGNSGSSGGPHLHFEIRDTQTEEPLNPLQYRFDVTDNTPPKIFALEVAPLSNPSHVNYSSDKQVFPIVFYDGKYHLKENPVIPVYGEIGFAIEANDYFDGTWNKCGIFSITLFIDGEMYFQSKIERFSFAESKAVNSYIDYEEYVEHGRRFQKTWRDPGNQLEIYDYLRNEGVFKVRDGNPHLVKIEVDDVYGNRSILEFRVNSKYKKMELPEEKMVAFFNYDKPNEYQSENFKIEIPAGSLYKNLKFNYQEKKAKGFYSGLHIIHSEKVPLHNNAEVKIKAENLPERLQSKVLLADVDTVSGRAGAAGGEFYEGWVVASIRSFGNYALAVDTIPPRVVPLSIASNSRLTEPDRIRFKITDDFSGIKKYEGFIDGKWALFEYEAKYNLITHYFDPQRFKLPGRHDFQLIVTDYKNNTTTYEASFRK